MMFNGEVEKVMRKQRQGGGGGGGGGMCWLRRRYVFEEKGEEFSLDSKEDKVVPKVDDVSLVDGVFDGVFGGDRDEHFSIGDEAMEEEESEEDDEENEEDDHYLLKK
ncbi:hypothetical protein Tco_1357694 [Tanacetum coccineum]